MMMFILAQEGGGADWGNLAQYGVLGMVVLAFIFGKMVPGYIYERKCLEYEAEKAENQRLTATIQDQVIPALLRSTDIMGQVLDLLSDLDPPAPRSSKRPS